MSLHKSPTHCLFSCPVNTFPLIDISPLLFKNLLDFDIPHFEQVSSVEKWLDLQIRFKVLKLRDFLREGLFTIFCNTLEKLRLSTVLAIWSQFEANEKNQVVVQCVNRQAGQKGPFAKDTSSVKLASSCFKFYITCFYWNLVKSVSRAAH